MTNSESTVDRVLVRIHHWTGINLLGVLLLLFWALGSAFTMGIETDSRVVYLCVVFLPWGLTVLADLGWRTFRNRDYDGSRFFYPFAGGAFAYVPVWLWLVAFPLIILGIVAVTR